MSTEFTPPVRADLQGVSAYGAPQSDAAARLNVNENPFPLPAEVVRGIAAVVETVAPGLNRYPDRDAEELRAELARYIARESGVNVPGVQLWAANGSNEVMHQLFLAFGGPGRTAITFDPTYSMYPQYARDTFTEYRSYPRKPDHGVDIDAAIEVIGKDVPALVLLSSPNNPTGTALPFRELRPLADAALDCGALIVVDEAYAEFRRAGVPSACELLAAYPNLVVTRTMSKAFGLAGARIGYAIAADPRVVDALRVVRLPYHLSAVTQAVGIAALRHAGVLQEQVALLRTERDALALWLTERGVGVVPSDANFLLFGPFPDRSKVWHALLDEGVLIREVGPDGWLRVSIGTPDENAMFRRALEHATVE